MKHDDNVFNIAGMVLKINPTNSFEIRHFWS